MELTELENTQSTSLSRIPSSVMMGVIAPRTHSHVELRSVRSEPLQGRMALPVRVPGYEY